MGYILTLNRKYVYMNINGLLKSKNFKCDVTEIQKEKLELILNYKNQSKNKKMTVGEVLLINDLCFLYQQNLFEKYKEYKNTNSMVKKVEIRHGEDGVKLFKKRLKERPKHNKTSQFKWEYWVSQGYNEKEAKERAKKIAKRCSLKAMQSKRNSNTKFYKWQSPLSNEYWIKKGYSLQEAELLRMPYLEKCDTSLNGFIKRYGYEEGMYKFNQKNLKWKDSIKKKYDIDNPFFVMSKGIASKESLKVFIPLYKILRKNGYGRNDLFFGVNGSKEYWLRREGDFDRYFLYDFTIKSKKLIIEYNGVSWHGNDNFKDKFRGENFGYTFEESKEIDKKKIECAEKDGFKVLVLWSIDSFDCNIKKCLSFIEGNNV